MRAALFALAFAVPLLAGEEEELLKSLATRQVSLNFDQTPLSEVAAFVTDVSGVAVRVFPGVDGDAPVTLKVKDLSLDNAMKLALAAAGEGVELRAWCGVVWLLPAGTQLPAVPAPPEGSPLARKLSVSFAATPLPDVAAFLGDLTGLKVGLAEVDRGQLEEVTVDLKMRETTLAKLLAILRATADVEAKLEGEALTFALAPLAWEGKRVDAIEVVDEPGRQDRPRRRTITDRAALKQLVACLAPVEVQPSGGENAWRLILTGKGAKMREVWVFDGGEWGYDGKSRGLSKELPRLLERLLKE